MSMSADDLSFVPNCGTSIFEIGEGKIELLESTNPEDPLEEYPVNIEINSQ